jgi:dsRNA-specific ribonuclease
MQNYRIVENIIGYKFKHPELLIQGFTHLSFINLIEAFKAH